VEPAAEEEDQEALAASCGAVLRQGVRDLVTTLRPLPSSWSYAPRRRAVGLGDSLPKPESRITTWLSLLPSADATVEDRASKRVAVRVAFSLVRGRPRGACRSTQQQVGTLTAAAEPPDEHLESVLGATPHEFESRILRSRLNRRNEEPGRNCGPALRCASVAVLVALQATFRTPRQTGRRTHPRLPAGSRHQPALRRAYGTWW
jgi:hypothetical protein